MRRWTSALALALLAGCGGGFPPMAGKDQISIADSDEFPKAYGGIEIQGVLTEDRGGLLLGQLHALNPGGARVIWVKGNWYTSQGIHVEDPKETWREIPFASGEEKSVHFTAPHPTARHLRVQIRKGSARPR